MNEDLAERLAKVPDFDDDESPLERPAPPRQPSQVYSLRIPADKLELLRRFAAEQGVAPSTLMRHWVLEHLDPTTGGSPYSSFRLVDRVIELEQEVAEHRKSLTQQSLEHQNQLDTAIEMATDRVLEVLTQEFEIRPKAKPKDR